MYGGPRAVKNAWQGSVSIWIAAAQEEGRTLAEHAERELDDEQQNTTAWRETEYLWHEALVQRRGALFPEDCHEAIGLVIDEHR